MDDKKQNEITQFLNNSDIKQIRDEIMEKLNDPVFLSKLANEFENINKIYFKQKGLHKEGNQALITKGFNFYDEDYTITHKETNGYVFFTRPKLNLLTSNLFGHRLLSFLNTMEPTSPSFAIRCLLDPIFTRNNFNVALKSPLFDPTNPFIPILTNRIVNISGFPDLVMETETTEGGYFSENITMAKGWDGLNKTYDLTATFNDVRGGFITALVLLWFIWIDCAIKGSVLAYKKYIEERKLCYTISIYRFLMDETNTFITKWAKATGCFPVSVPMGAFFNFDSSNQYVLESKNLSIPFKVVMKIEYMDPVILWEFNELVKRYCPMIDQYTEVKTDDWFYVNGRMIPYIDLETGYNKLTWRVDPTLLHKKKVLKYPIMI